MGYENYAGAWLPLSTQGVQVTGSTPYQTVYGPNVDATWGVTGQGDTLVGGTADNFYWLPNPGTIVQQQVGGTNTVEIWQSYTLPTNVQNLIVFGTNQYASGNSLNNVIKPPVRAISYMAARVTTSSSAAAAVEPPLLWPRARVIRSSRTSPRAPTPCA